MPTIPASIRNKNPGAMYPGKASRKFGSKRTNIIGGGHQIAQFPTKIQGAAAQFWLLNRPTYSGKTLKHILATWSGGNSVDQYVKVVSKATGLKADDVVSWEYMQEADNAVEFAQAMAKHEAGDDYPLTELQWTEAHALANPIVTRSNKGGWMALAEAAIGVREWKGRNNHNPRIMKWYVDVGKPAESDEVPNCAAFVGSILKRSGMKYLSTLVARDYLNLGTVKKDPKLEDVAVMWRESPQSWKGHVGFVKGFTRTKIKLLGANQRNSVNITEYPRNEFLGFVTPPPAMAPIGKTIWSSKSLKTGVNGVFSIIVGAVLTLWDGIQYTWGLTVDLAGQVLGLVPDAVVFAEGNLSLAQRVLVLVNVAWPMVLGTTLALACFGYAFWRGLQQRRAA